MFSRVRGCGEESAGSGLEAPVSPAACGWNESISDDGVISMQRSPEMFHSREFDSLSSFYTVLLIYRHVCTYTYYLLTSLLHTERFDI